MFYLLIFLAVSTLPCGVDYNIESIIWMWMCIVLQVGLTRASIVFALAGKWLNYWFLPGCCSWLSVPTRPAWECHRASICLRKHQLSLTSDPDLTASAPSGCPDHGLALSSTQTTSATLSSSETQDAVNIIARHTVFSHARGMIQSKLWGHGCTPHI